MEISRFFTGSTVPIYRSDLTGEEFSFFTFEAVRGGEEGDKAPVASGDYQAKTREDNGKPWRIELLDVPGYENIQIHVGNDLDDVIGCWVAGRTYGKDNVGGSADTMRKLREIVDADRPLSQLNGLVRQEIVVNVDYADTVPFSQRPGRVF